VSLHVPLTLETTGLFNAERFAWISDWALLVDKARGVKEESFLPLVHLPGYTIRPNKYF
jgi:hypothetical protein